MDKISWPTIWTCLKGVPYHCWSRDTLLSLASSIGRPVKLDYPTTTQRILSYARVLVDLDLSKPRHHKLLVELEGEGEVELDVLMKNCLECLSLGHTLSNYPLSVRIINQCPSSYPLTHPGSSKGIHKSPAPQKSTSINQVTVDLDAIAVEGSTVVVDCMLDVQSPPIIEPGTIVVAAIAIGMVEVQNPLVRICPICPHNQLLKTPRPS
ncbi:hypothetical protein AAC387_Pa06g1478 [Persea americana]